MKDLFILATPAFWLLGVWVGYGIGIRAAAERAKENKTEDIQ